jgi:tRNA (cmo5U34)-methyltransferase
LKISTVFDIAAHDYDATRKKYISCFDDFYGVAIEQIPHDAKNTFRVLDLGAGTGLFASLVKNAFPNSKVTLADISGEMLVKAKERFRHNDKVDFMHHDYINEDLPGKFDVVISALSLHHSTEAELLLVFKKINRFLTDKGIFINADQILGKTPEIEQAYQHAWLSQAITNGCTDQEILVALKRMESDKTLPLEKQLKLLEEAGFGCVNCWYQHYRYAVYSGVKWN